MNIARPFLCVLMCSQKALQCELIPIYNIHVAFSGDLHCNYGNMHVDAYTDRSENRNTNNLNSEPGTLYSKCICLKQKYRLDL